MERRIGLIIPTFHRDGALRQTLELVAAQTRPPDEVVVVDNAGAHSCRNLCDELDSISPFILTYLAEAENGGPAGATATGMKYLLDRLGDTDWIVRADDDTPQVGEGHLRLLLDACAEASASFEMLGGVGTTGARFDPRRAQLMKPPIDVGFVPVDYLPTGFYPFYSVGAVRSVGVFRADLFFGHSEVEYGLRLRRAGFAVLRLDGPTEDRSYTEPSASLGEPTWRRYYSLRNRVVIAQEFGTRLAPYRVIAIAIVKPLANFPRAPKLALAHLRMNLSAVRDALGGRLGRTVEPRTSSGTLDSRT